MCVLATSVQKKKIKIKGTFNHHSTIQSQAGEAMVNVMLPVTGSSMTVYSISIIYFFGGGEGYS